MTLLATRECACAENIALGQKRPPFCIHGNRYLTEAQLNPKPRKPLQRVSEKRQSETRRGSTLKQGKGFAGSSAQQKKVRDLPCVVCGRDRHEAQIHAAHVYPRRLAACECADGVVPLCAEHHRLYDDPNLHLDLLPALITRGYRKEIAHAFLEHGVSYRDVLEQVTGVPWAPSSERKAVA